MDVSVNRRPTIRRLSFVLGLGLAIVMASAAPSMAQGNPPDTECGVSGVSYNKYQITNGSVGSLESNTDPKKVVDLSDGEADFEFDYENLFPEDWEIFRIVIKSGKTPDVVLDDPAQSGTLNAPSDVSHITFCLRKPPPPPPPPEEPDVVDVQVELGACTTDGITSSTPLTVTITGDGSATVVLKDASDAEVATFSESGSTNLAPGTYTYTVTADEDSTLSEGSDTGGQLEVLDCTPEIAPLGSVAVTTGACTFTGGQSLTPVTIEIAPSGAATVVVTGDGVSETFTGSGGSVELPAGDYSWSATASEDFSLTGDTSGSFTNEECSTVLPRRLARTGSFDDLGAIAGSGAGLLALGLLMLFLAGRKVQDLVVAVTGVTPRRGSGALGRSRLHGSIGLVLGRPPPRAGPDPG